MLISMSRPRPVDLDDEVIDVGPPPRRRWWRWIILAAVVLLFGLSRTLSIYVEALWFGSLGYSSVYWYTFRLKLALFIIFALVTVIILRVAFWLLERLFAPFALERRVIILNNQPVSISPARILRPLAWIISLFFGLIYGLGMSAEWQTFALFLHHQPTGISDPIFSKPLSFYLFTLPLQQLLNSWLMMLAFIILCGSLLYTLLSLPQQISNTAKVKGLTRGTGYAAVSCALAGFLLLLAWRVYLARFPYLWTDHQTFTGVTYTEANYLLPGYIIVAIALIIAAAIVILNAFTQRRLRWLIAAIALPVAVFVVAGILIPAYVTSFIVKPNELGRETPYIEHNIEWTRRAFGLDRIEQRNFEAEASHEAFDLSANQATLDNIRLWDWRALQDTLRQIQTIRTYYDFPDVDVDLYHIGG